MSVSVVLCGSLQSLMRKKQVEFGLCLARSWSCLIYNDVSWQSESPSGAVSFTCNATTRFDAAQDVSKIKSSYQAISRMNSILAVHVIPT